MQIQIFSPEGNTTNKHIRQEQYSKARNVETVIKLGDSVKKIADSWAVCCFRLINASANICFRLLTKKFNISNV